MRFTKWLAACAAGFLAFQPCLAAEQFRADGAGQRQSSAFAGIAIRVPLGRAAGARKATARLQLTTFHERRDSRGGAMVSQRHAGVELGFNARGRAAYFVGGQELRKMDERLHAKGSTKWIIIGGVLVLVVLVAASFAAAQPTAGPPPGTFD
jgi:hypothetical protein